MVSLLRAILYVRVSTSDQGNMGYSLSQQLASLRSYCADNNIEVVAEFTDTASGASLDRPGLDALRDLVSLGGIGLVLAQDRDRISREPAHVYILREELREHGTTLRALNDSGDDSPEGVLHDSILDHLAKFERAKTAERTRRGRMMKAQEGKVVGTGTTPYGFYYADDHYHIHPDRMPYVHEIFERVSAGESLCSIVRHLNRVGAPTTRGGPWSTPTVRGIIENDIYTRVSWWGKTHRTNFTKTERPRSEWIGVPVPDSGVPEETIARAREVIKGNTKSVSKNDGRVWELSGGVGVCSECGRRMVGYTTINSVKKHYHYYRCSGKEPYGCTNRKNYRAGELEDMVKDAIREAFEPETWATFVDDLCDRKLQDLRSASRVTSQETLVVRMQALETKLDRARDLFIDGDLPRPAYEEKKGMITDEIEVIQEQLTKVDDLDAEIRRVEDLRRVLMSVENPLSGYYKLDYFPDVVVALRNNMYYGSEETAALRRQEFYRRMGMKVKVGEDGLEISIGVDGISVSKTIVSSEKPLADRPKC